jgi:hypothetical protein
MNKQKVLNLIILFIAIVSVSFGVYSYYQLHNARNNSQEAAKKEITDIVSKVSNLYLLPTGEDPTIATVSDPSVLKNQLFFTNSEKGDKVLIYTKAGRAILYRPSINKIIESAPITGGSKTENITTPTTPTAPETKVVTPTTNTSKTTTSKTR